MSRFLKPCLECGTLSREARCPTHLQAVKQLHEAKRQQVKKETGQYSGAYKRRAAQVRATAITCHICGDGPRFNDPWEADHINPGTNGTEAELKAAHRSCNQRRGAKPA